MIEIIQKLEQHAKSLELGKTHPIVDALISIQKNPDLRVREKVEKNLRLQEEIWKSFEPFLNNSKEFERGPYCHCVENMSDVKLFETKSESLIIDEKDFDILESAEDLITSGNSYDAFKLISQLHDKYPENLRILADLISIKFENPELDNNIFIDVKKYHYMVLNDSSSQNELLLQDCEFLSKKGSPPYLFESIEKILMNEPYNRMALIFKANYYIKKNRPSLAAKCYLKILSLDVRDEVMTDLGKLFISCNDMQGAELAFSTQFTVKDEPIYYEITSSADFYLALSRFLQGKIEPGISPDGYHRFHYEELEYFAAQRYDQLGSSVLFPVNEFTVSSLLIYAFVAFLGDESELGKKILEFSIERKLVTSDNAFQLYSAAFKLKKTNPINLGKQDLFFVRHFFNPIDWQDWDKKISMD